MAISDFSAYPVYSLFKPNLKYLQTSTDILKHSSKSGELKSAEEAESLLVEKNLSEIDREMSRIIGQDLEHRKLEQKHNSDINLPYSGLLNASEGSRSILLKKKKKFVVKPIS